MGPSNLFNAIGKPKEWHTSKSLSSACLHSMVCLPAENHPDSACMMLMNR